MDSQEIKKLVAGTRHFREKFFSKGTSSFFEALVEHGQKPKTMVIACSDSRVDPVMIFNCQPGDLFVVRSIANLIPPCERDNAYHGTSAALEFGVCFLKVEHIIIFGHTRCGGIQTLLTGINSSCNEEQSFIAKWLEIARPAYTYVMAERAEAGLAEKVVLCERQALLNSLKNLRTFPWIQQRINEGKLSIHAWYFDLETGFVYAYDQETDNWVLSQ